MALVCRSGGTVSRLVPALVLDGTAIPHINPVYNLGVVLDSLLLLSEHMAIMARRAFEQVHLILPFVPKSESAVLIYSHSCLSLLQVILLQFVHMDTLIKKKTIKKVLNALHAQTTVAFNGPLYFI